MRWVFVAAAMAAAGFIWLTGVGLPAVVPSHFDAHGMVNGHMPRTAYLVFITAISVLAPASIVFLPGSAMRVPGARINLPNGAYWLAPERKEQAIRMTENLFAGFGMLVLGFLCFAHWQVVRAASSDYPHMDMAVMHTGLALFMAALAAWTILFLWQFRRR